MARKMTPAEKQRFKNYFPRLNVNRATVTGPTTHLYNCISWTLGITSRWIWPGTNISDFDKLYHRHGFVRSSNGPIAAWGHNQSKMTHGCISGPNHGSRWESKCGSDLRIQHGLSELVGASYGNVLAFFSRKHRTPSSDIEEQIRNIESMESLNQLQLEESAVKILGDAVENIDSEIRTQFEVRFEAWKGTWSATHTAHLSDPSFVRYSKEFSDLAALGEQIVPLLIDKLRNPNNFFALQLYDAIQPEQVSIVRMDANDEGLVLGGEQGRARRTVQRWLGNQ